MGRLSEMVNKRPLLSVAVAAIVLATAVVLVFFRGGIGAGSTVPVKVDFLDETTNDLVQLSESEIPPVTNEAGHTLVRAYTDRADAKRVLYLEKYSDDAKTAFADQLRDTPELQKAGKMRALSMSDAQSRWVRRPEKGSEWVNAITTEGQVIERAGR